MTRKEIEVALSKKAGLKISRKKVIEIRKEAYERMKNATNN